MKRILLILVAVAAIAGVPAATNASGQCQPTNITYVGANRLRFEFDGGLVGCLDAWRTVNPEVAAAVDSLVIVRYTYNVGSDHSVLTLRLPS